jgi:hypothetical protein
MYNEKKMKKEESFSVHTSSIHPYFHPSIHPSFLPSFLHVGAALLWPLVS